MATLRQYFETDFDHAFRVAIEVPGQPKNVEAATHCDFAGNNVFFSILCSGQDWRFHQLIAALEALNPPSAYQISGSIRMPSTRYVPGDVYLKNQVIPELRVKFHGDADWKSFQDLPTTRRVFLYCETRLSHEDVIALKDYARVKELDLQLRPPEYADKRSATEVPLAFISHDSRDKQDVAQKIAVGLTGLMCPVWYDEFSLRVGSKLRQSIEKGLRECKKCVLVLSKNFLANTGWTRIEFDSVFTRELVESSNLILPVWYGVSRAEIFEYCPSLCNILGLDWNKLGFDEVVRRLHREIIQET